MAPETDAVRLELLAAEVPIDPTTIIPVLSSDELKQRLKAAGTNPRLELSGRPGHRVETEDTARVYRQDGCISVFTPSVLEDRSSYLADDPEEMLESVVDELHLLQRHWRGVGLPLLVIPIRETALDQHRDVILKLADQLSSGVIETIPVRLSRLSQLVDQGQEVQLPPLQQKPVTTSHQPQHVLRDATDLRDLTAAEEQELDDTPIEQLSQRLWSSGLLHEQAEVLELLQRRLGPQGIQRSPDGHPVALSNLLEEVYQRGLRCEDWNLSLIHI